MNEPTKTEDRQIEESILKPPSDLERVLAAVDHTSENLTGPGRLIMQALGISLLTEIRLKALDSAPPTPEPPKIDTPPKRPLIERLLRSAGS